MILVVYPKILHYWSEWHDRNEVDNEALSGTKLPRDIYLKNEFPLTEINRLGLIARCQCISLLKFFFLL